MFVCQHFHVLFVLPLCAIPSIAPNDAIQLPRAIKFMQPVHTFSLMFLRAGDRWR